VKSPLPIIRSQMTGRRRLPLLGLASLLVAALACANVPEPTPDQGALATQVAATLTALATVQPSPTASEPPTVSPLPVPTDTPSPAPTASPTPPVGGVSLNCDETYQRVRLVDNGDAGRTLVVDEWSGTGWDVAWQFEGGNPIIRQLTEEAGAYSFGGCQQLLVVPLLYEGSGGILELHVYLWQAGTAVEVYSDDGSQGQWEIIGDNLHFEKAVYLLGEPNCCPCNRQVSDHQWTGAAFVEVETEVVPTYSGTPPSVCQ
jgi:hypothetical protein